MNATSRFNLDAFAPPLPQDVSGTVVGDTTLVLLVVEGFLPTDALVQATFTAKLAKTDADGAPGAVQVILLNDGSGGIAPVGTDGTRFLFSFPLTAAQSVTLETVHGYDVRVWLNRGGLTYARTVQTGNFIAPLGWTSRLHPVSGGLTNETGAILVQEA